MHGFFLKLENRPRAGVISCQLQIETDSGRRVGRELRFTERKKWRVAVGQDESIVSI